jgi:hypothetical protein
MSICNETVTKERRTPAMGRAKDLVTPMGKGNWTVKREGASRADSVHAKTSDAVERARDLGRSSKPSLIIIHGRDGTILTEHTYGPDPYPPEG